VREGDFGSLGWNADVWRLVGATLLGVIGPPGTRGIAKHHPETGWLAWRFMTTTGGIVAIMALFRVMVLLGP